MATIVANQRPARLQNPYTTRTEDWKKVACEKRIARSKQQANESRKWQQRQECVPISTASDYTSLPEKLEQRSEGNLQFKP